MVNHHDRINFQPDFLFSIVEVPRNWRPAAVYDVPPSGRVVSQMRVASFEEAHEDLVRCNKIALQKRLRQWAVIQTAGAGT